MPAATPVTERIPGYCSPCISRCGSIAVVEDGRFVALEPDPSHPTGQALCAKGKAAPELVYGPDSQHRSLPSSRRRGRDPEVELHPSAAGERGVRPGDSVHMETPAGSVRARARLNGILEPNVVCYQHSWWQACTEIGAPGYDPFGPDGANFNLIVADDAIDPASGSVPHRAYLCEVRRAG
jgi:anaerobic selenocysteine-containing dehydrogenase